MCQHKLLFLAVLLFPGAALTSVAGQVTITPTTTLAAQTSNNTSAAASFSSQTNGNLGAGNVSKLDVHSLLYPGASTKVFAHLVLWFGETNHMNIGYSSTDPVQVKRQINDMISRGIDGVVMVWYGPHNSIDQAAQLVMREAENHPDFTFALMVDHGAILWDSCSGCTPQQALTAQMQYIEQTYFPSPAYLRVGGQPVVTNFDMDLFYQIDWNALSASLASAPTFLFQNSGGFTHALSGGAYSWVMPTTSDWGLSYLSSFYSMGSAHPSLETMGAAYKGFNDSLASWGTNRTMSQQCGQTWLKTFSEINSRYNSTDQLPSMQLVTWNDYEEGTEIESGIDNCASVSPLLSGNSLRWSVAGGESTIDHYTVYISNDGQNLMPLVDQPAGSQTLDLCSYSFEPGKYTLYVQAIGKPVLANHISSPIGYTPQCASSTPPTIAVSASPSFLTIRSGQSGNLNVTVASQAGSFNQAVKLSCSNVPAWMSCTFSPAVVIPGSQTARSVVSISANRTSGAVSKPALAPKKLSFYGCFLPLAFAGLVANGAHKKRATRFVVLSMVIAAVMLLASCGGTNSSAPVPLRAAASGNTYSITITGDAGSAHASTVATVTIQ